MAAITQTLIEPVVQPLSPVIGAMIDNINLSLEQRAATIGLIYQALLDHQVIFFLGQAILVVDVHRQR